MRPKIILFFIGVVLSICSCRSDFETVASKGDLEFSKDTIYLDTVFTNINRSEKRQQTDRRRQGSCKI